MLSSIHPLGERSRHNRFAVTATAHIGGAALGGAALGALAGVVAGASALVWGAESPSRAVAMAVVTVGALVAESTDRAHHLPTRRHQVDENWIQRYRGWVYGGGFGFELGFGLSTIITTALVHVMVLAMILTGSPVRAVAIGVAFGIVRGATILAGWRVVDPEQLRTFHRRLDIARSRFQVAGSAVLGLASVVTILAVTA